MSIKAKKKILQYASALLMLLGFIIVPAGLAFWLEAHPERSVGVPLLLAAVHLLVCVALIFAIADYWKALNKSEELKKGESDEHRN